MGLPDHLPGHPRRHRPRRRAAGLDPDQISFTTALRAVRRTLPAARDQPAAALAETEADLLASLVPQRDGRICPRAVTEPLPVPAAPPGPSTPRQPTPSPSPHPATAHTTAPAQTTPPPPASALKFLALGYCRLSGTSTAGRAGPGPGNDT